MSFWKKIFGGKTSTESATPKQICAADFDSIAKGMTMSQVVSVVGIPTKIVGLGDALKLITGGVVASKEFLRRANADPDPLWGYVDPLGDGYWSIQFKSGRVEGVTKWGANQRIGEIPRDAQ